MYLTRMYLNPARRGTRALVGSPQKMHAAVLSAFPPGTPTETESGRVLWRLDVGKTHELTLLISSPVKPDLAHVVEQAGWPTGQDHWQSAPLSRLTERLETGQSWAFRLTANPVRSVAQGSGRGKRVGHATVQHQLEWLVERSADWGFDIGGRDGRLTADVVSRRGLSFERRSDGDRRQITLTTATYEGTLTVSDPKLLRLSMGHGLGRAKGYGCGLLTLAPRT
ncbi:type I-E CRISPR-associated protein Cas6/Cse3/CasE [Nocardioides albidus]|uniref:Type I-E CRISPR-associated protein Cas6/Cse3/CasE n=2 Tax=Nocardioides albidus TaxID=1517589 RepID=A0A5C4VR28_9ACTN|nr:type I-E CRISPR-associated protein Cas6/Cse3/CasE [Nocardioides albidus]